MHLAILSILTVRCLIGSLMRHVHHRLSAANHISTDHVAEDLVGVGRGIFGPPHHN